MKLVDRFGFRHTPTDRTPLLAAQPQPTAKAGAPGVATLRLYDPIDSWGEPFGVSAKEFVDTLDGLPADTTEIRLHINSPGGEIFEAVAILNALRNQDAKVVCIVDGIAASAASFVAMAGDEVVMGQNAEMMIHDGMGICLGNAEDMRKLAGLLDHLSANIASVYQARAGETVEHWRALMLEETWFSAAEAVEAGLADRVEESQVKPTNDFDLTVFKHAGRADAPAPADIAPVAKAAPKVSDTSSAADAADESAAPVAADESAADAADEVEVRRALAALEDYRLAFAFG